MFDDLLDKIRKPHDVEAAVAELTQAVSDQLLASQANPDEIGQVAAWLNEHQTEVAHAIATEEDRSHPSGKRARRNSHARAA